MLDQLILSAFLGIVFAPIAVYAFIFLFTVLFGKAINGKAKS